MQFLSHTTVYICVAALSLVSTAQAQGRRELPNATGDGYARFFTDGFGQGTVVDSGQATIFNPLGAAFGAKEAQWRREVVLRDQGTGASQVLGSLAGADLPNNQTSPKLATVASDVMVGPDGRVRRSRFASGLAGVTVELDQSASCARLTQSYRLINSTAAAKTIRVFAFDDADLNYATPLTGDYGVFQNNAVVVADANGTGSDVVRSTSTLTGGTRVGLRTFAVPPQGGAAADSGGYISTMGGYGASQAGHFLYDGSGPFQAVSNHVAHDANNDKRSDTAADVAGSHIHDVRVPANGSAMFTFVQQLTPSACNLIARAGDDRAACEGPVALDASASTAPANAVYTWFDGATEIGTGVTASVNLTMGLHEIFLRVCEGAACAVDSAMLTITAPCADADMDGLPDAIEAKLGTNPMDADSDDDGLLDGQEDADHDGIRGGNETNPLDADSDDDGLRDGTEVFGPSMTNPLNPDTDGDGLRDGVEDADHNGMVGPTETSPLNPDTDNGGVDDGVEVARGTNPLNAADDAAAPDTDKDGLPDVMEQQLGTDPTNPDTDGDGLKDGAEVAHGTSPLNPDTDGDGVKDGPEVLGSNPTNPRNPDSDGDGLRDGEEDADQDGVLDPTESNPNDADTDDGGVGDGVEVANGTNPLIAADDKTGVDTDQDGLTDAAEQMLGTNPNDADSDDDGVLDGAEPGAGEDHDGDGRIGALDPDSDGDGLKDGTELGVTTAPAATDAAAGNFVPDADPMTRTNPLVADSDGGGISDGTEDANRNGKVDAGEGNPEQPRDDDSDRDGLTNAEEDRNLDGFIDGTETDPYDNDTDDDGLPDGVERLGQTRTNPRQRDSDQDGLADGAEDRNANGSVDADETNPNDADSDDGGVGDGVEARNGTSGLAAADDKAVADSDGDGLSDAAELAFGSDPNVADSDGDGLDDARELGVGSDPSLADSDGDGLDDRTEVEAANPTNPRDRDSDNDGLTDGEEDANHNGKVDGSESNPADPDSDDGGVMDGVEVANQTNPRVASDDRPAADRDADGLSDAAEGQLGTNPDDADSDDDGVIDGREPGLRHDDDGDGKTGALDADSDADGIMDGTEVGITTAHKDTQPGSGFVVDADPASKTDPLNPDSDGGGVKDGLEDANHNGSVDTGENNPQDPKDDAGAGGWSVTGGACQSGGVSNMIFVAFALAFLVWRSRKRFAGVTLAAVALTMVAAPRAEAQSTDTRFSIERFRLSSDRYGLLNLEWADLPPKWSFELNAWLGYANDPLILRSGDGTEQASIVTRRLGGEVGGSLVLAKWLGLAVRAPVVVSQKGEVSAISDASFDNVGIGDVRVLAKLRLASWLALIPAAVLPTASSDDYYGQSGVSWEPEVALSGRFSRVRVGLNGGVKLRDEVTFYDLTVGNEVWLHGGVGLALTKKLELGVTTLVSTALKDFLDRKNQNAAEVMAGVQGQVGEHLMLFAAGGAGVRRGYGTPDWRALAGLRVWFGGKSEGAAAKPVNEDPDGDGLFGPKDACPNEPETVNNFEDDDGCPDVADADKDGISDADDKCKDEPEDKDEFEDADGCPDPDNDSDGVLDVNDKCINEAGVKENRGCPDTDRDGDTIVDRLDNCPDEPGVAKHKGCKGKQLVAITDGKLEILDKVYFQTNKAVILTKSYKLLNNVAAVIKSHPELTLVTVEGHTDSRGDDAANQTLSENRANSVREYLIAQGVEDTRLKAVGYGETKPIAPNTTNSGRSTNRRVEFVLGGDVQGVEQKNSGPGAETMD